MILAGTAMGALRRDRGRRATARVRHDGRDRRVAALDLGVRVVGGGASCSARGSRSPPLLGWLLAEMLVAMLRHVFDPPPDALSIPWSFLVVLAGAALAGAVVAGATAVRQIRALPLGEILREQ